MMAAVINGFMGLNTASLQHTPGQAVMPPDEPSIGIPQLSFPFGSACDTSI